MSSPDQSEHGGSDWPNVAVLLIVFAACLGALSFVDHMPRSSIGAGVHRATTSAVNQAVP